MLDMRVEDYRITSDELQVVVHKVRRTDSGEVSMLVDKKTGDEYESKSLVGYYGDLSKALVGIQRDWVLSGDTSITTIPEYKKAIDSITKAFEESIGMIDSKSLVIWDLPNADNSVGTITSGTIKGVDVL